MSQRLRDLTHESACTIVTQLTEIFESFLTGILSHSRNESSLWGKQNKTHCKHSPHPSSPTSWNHLYSLHHIICCHWSEDGFQITYAVFRSDVEAIGKISKHTNRKESLDPSQIQVMTSELLVPRLKSGLNLWLDFTWVTKQPALSQPESSCNHLRAHPWKFVLPHKIQVFLHSLLTG